MNGKKTLFLIILALLIFSADFLLKTYVHTHVPTVFSASRHYPFGGIGVFSNWHGIDFSIVHVINKGAAWGIFSSAQKYLLYVRVLIIGALFSYLLFVKASFFRKMSLTLILAGATGNVLDYFLYGHVVDMFYFIFWGYSYPVFNIADAAIFCGITLLLGQSAFQKLRTSLSSSANSAG